MLLQKTAEHFRIKNPLIAKGDYAEVVDSLGIPTGVTKQGIGKYYNDTPQSTVNIDISPNGTRTAKSAGAIPVSGTAGTMKVISFTGVVDGVNCVFVCSHVPLIVTADTQFLLLTLGYTRVGLTVTTVNPPSIGIAFYGNY